MRARRLLALLALLASACSPGTPVSEAPPPPSTVLDAGSGDTSPTVPAPPPAPPPPVAGPALVMSPTGVPLPVVGQVDGGFQVTTPCENTVTIPAGVPLAGAMVVLDPGHGGSDPGAVGYNALSEAVLNLAVAEGTRRALERAGVSVVVTRAGDHDMTLEARARVGRALRARAFVSVHHNAAADEPLPGPGTDVYHQEASAESRRLAGLVYEEVVAALAVYAVDWVGAPPVGVKYLRGRRGTDYYGVLRRSAGVPAVLTEAAYLSNPAEAALLARDDVQAAESDALARGILRFLHTSDPGSGFVQVDQLPGTPPPRGPGPGPGRAPPACTDPPLS